MNEIFATTLTVERAFSAGNAYTLRGSSHPGLARNDDHRYYAFTKLAQAQFAGPSVPPPADFGPGFSAKPPDAVPSPVAFPSLTFDMSYPLTNHMLVAGTAFQHNAFVQDQQKAIVGAIDTSTGLKEPAALAKCGSCATFQSLYSPAFVLNHGTDVLKASLKQIGGDDDPFSLKKVPDMDLGTLAQFSGSGVTATLAKVYWNAPKSFDETAFGATYAKGPLRVDALVVSSSNTLPFVAPPTGTPAPILPFARPTPPRVASHVSSYALAFAIDNPRATLDADSPFSPSGATRSDVSGLVRAAYDASERRLNALTGLHLERSFRSGEALRTVRGTVAYRGSGIGYHAPAGDPVGYPGVSGPFVNMSATRQVGRADGTALKTPEFSFTGYSMWNHLGDGVAAGVAPIGVDLTPRWTVTADIARARISEPLLATQQLSIGYPFVRDAFFTKSAAEATRSKLELRDNTVSISYKSIADPNVKGQAQIAASVGID
ncbi:MAG: hypothetical protein M3154_06590, partial [Candidatus Eremiobacteraeota bacterium]|nr:hypothetical protein [Candidatus Eremiobacteraeota bacterium]